jgi:cellulose synthase/poly-beta-1,6-N-acetylglucosamine synthase-like glycosyltransferase
MGSAVSIAWAAFFAQWWFQPEHWPQNIYGAAGPVAGGVIFVLVSYVVWYPIIQQIFSWAIAHQIRDIECSSAAPGLRVAFITTFVPQSESVELLQKCLPAMVSAAYSHDTWLLDEGDLPEARALCLKIGVKHFTRLGQDKYNTISGKFLRKTKGGNHNSWYDVHGQDYDFVAQLDTDFVPDPAYLERTLGYFKDPAVGFVGTPQVYGNTEASIIARGAAEQAYNFYGPILRGFSAMGTAVMIGANHVVRVAALQSVGHYSAHITEDVLTGMKLHAHGWKSVYVPEVLAVGEGPATWQAYFIQQMRWAYGSMDVFLRFSPCLLRRMTARRACYYFLLLQHYFSGLAMTLGLLGLGVYSAFGVCSVQISQIKFIEYYIPLIIMCEAMSILMQKYNVCPKTERGVLLLGRIISIAAWPYYMTALFNVIIRRRLIYKVTPKGIRKEESEPHVLQLFGPHYSIAAYCLLCLIVAITRHHTSAIMLFWLILSAAAMLTIPFTVPISRMLTGLKSVFHSYPEDLDPVTIEGEHKFV